MNKKYKYCFKEKKLIEYGEHDNEMMNDGKVVHEVKFEGDMCNVLTKSGAIYEEWNNFSSNLSSELISLSLTQKNYKNMIKLFINVLHHSKQLCKKLLEKNCNTNKNVFQCIDRSFEYIHKTINEIDSHSKLIKKIKSDPHFVEPIEKSIGLKWKAAKVDPQTNIPDHGLTQPTFQFVSILKTLESVFKNKDFENMYIKYNRQEKHICENGIYQDYCCGTSFQSNEIFNDPLTLRLQIGIDDFEVCCPVKSKATKHKINATYVQILNIPAEFRSKLENIYLVALCGSVNFKSKDYNYNHIAELIVDEFRILETKGMTIGNDIVLGTLINIACDNLGANNVAGFVECLVANHYCRFCECSRAECQTMTKENKHKVLTEIARKKMNFINLPKTLAMEHQERICKCPVLSSKIKPSESFGQFVKSMQYQKFKLIIERDIETDSEEIRVHKFASYNNIDYREGNLLIEKNRIYEIINILSINAKVYFICQLCKPLNYNHFCNSIEIEKLDNSTTAIDFDKLESRFVYDRIYAEGKFFVIAEKLNIANLL